MYLTHGRTAELELQRCRSFIPYKMLSRPASVGDFECSGFKTLRTHNLDVDNYTVHHLTKMQIIRYCTEWIQHTIRHARDN